MIRIVLTEDSDGSAKKIKVVRGGKVVTKKVRISKLPKRMSMKQRMALKKARRRANTVRAKKKRKKSMKRRSRIPMGQQKIGARLSSKRRSMARREDFNYEDVNTDFGKIDDEFEDKLLIAEFDFEFVDVEGNTHDVPEGYLVNVNEYEDDDLITLDVFDSNGDFYLEDIEVTLDTVTNLISSGMIAHFYTGDDDDESEL